MGKQLTFLFSPFDGIGHVNACIGVAQALQARGHRIVFAINEQWRGMLSAYGFEEELIKDSNRDPNDDPTKYWTEFTLKSGALMELSPLENLRIRSQGFQQILDNAKRVNPIIKEIVERIAPDIILIHDFIMKPSIINSGIPWVLLVSANPLFLYIDERLPPHYFGLSVNSDKRLWTEMNNQRTIMMANIRNNYNEWFIEHGLDVSPEGEYCYRSPYLNIYGYPEELDYAKITNSVPSKFYRINYFMRSEKSSEFEVPEKLKNISGKLIYLSLGSMGSGNVDLMKRLVSILAKSQHKFIVSKGQFHDQYELADNMWGDRTVPQTKVLPLVNLVITHGGNNTLTEALYFGKPLIAMPLNGDQYDNAQRLEDTGYGIRLDGFKCSETKLLDGIENVLNNQKLAIKLEKMSKRVQSSNSLTKAVELIEILANNGQSIYIIHTVYAHRLY